jgi:two-component system, NarL family, sensor kinase
MKGLRDLARGFQAQTRILTEFRTPLFDGPLPDDVASALYKVAGEALEGLERLSRATGVVMILRAGRDMISLSIRDDGVGLLARQGSARGPSPHTTIREMRRTVEAIGGAVTFEAARPRGLEVQVNVPLRVA